VDRADLLELHYITPISNVPSILVHGILSHELAERVAHRSIADPDVQARRAQKRAPLPRPLHSYVNLYINARNPMMYRRQGQHREICVIRISPEILDLPGVVITDQNAARAWCSFRPVATGLAYIDKEIVFAEFWTRYDDPLDRWRHAGIMCAEILLPNRLNPRHIVGAYVSCAESRAALLDVCPTLPVSEHPYVFFR
jgi:hypothetical protein